MPVDAEEHQQRPQGQAEIQTAVAAAAYASPGVPTWGVVHASSHASSRRQTPVRQTQYVDIVSSLTTQLRQSNLDKTKPCRSKQQTTQ
jgi:hypothetical protein